MPPSVPTSIKIKAAVTSPEVRDSSQSISRAGAAVGASGLVFDQPWTQLGAAVTLLGFAGEFLLAPAMDWLAKDPPDQWFHQEVRLKRSHLKPSENFDRADESVEQMLSAAEDANVCAANMRAMLRAIERFEGAQAAGDEAAAKWRSSDWVSFKFETQ